MCLFGYESAPEQCGFAVVAHQRRSALVGYHYWGNGRAPANDDPELDGRVAEEVNGPTQAFSIPVEFIAANDLPLSVKSSVANLDRIHGIQPVMKAIQVKQPGGPEVMELVDLPVPEPKANEAVVKLAASGVNFIDVYHREGRYKVALPFTPGQEGAGVVTAAGSDVKSVKVGDRVAWSHLLGSYAEYEVLAADRLVPIPAGVSDQQAAAAMLQGMTAHYPRMTPIR